jgi:hypothetical protein
MEHRSVNDLEGKFDLFDADKKCKRKNISKTKLKFENIYSKMHIRKNPTILATMLRSLQARVGMG